MKNIKLTQGYFAIVDDSDYEWLNHYTWYFGHGYAVRNKSDSNPYRFMHRMILNTPEGMDTDHLNLDRLDNRRENLRICTASRNQQNRLAHSDNSSGYKGVSRHGIGWMAQIMCSRKKFYLGTYRTKEEAAIAYDKKAIELHGEFSILNFSRDNYE